MEILFVSGLSGAGKSSAASYLEDIGYYTVDNMPFDIIMKFAEFCSQSDGRYDRVAMVCDIRSNSSDFSGLLNTIEQLREGGTFCRLLFLDAKSETIIKRYKETRRSHPLMRGSCTSIESAFERENELLRPLREHADIIIDTTQMPIAKLKSELYTLFGDKTKQTKLNVNVISFGYKYGIPLEADLVFDVRFMPNPFYIPELRGKTGMDQDVYDYVFQFEQAQTFLKKLQEMVSYLLPHYSEEGKTMLVIAIGCTGGHHRSVSIARALTDYIKSCDYPVQINHRDLMR